MNESTVSRLLSPKEVALILGVSPGTLAIWRCTKRYALSYRKIGRLVKYHPLDVSDFIELCATNNSKPRPSV